MKNKNQQQLIQPKKFSPVKPLSKNEMDNAINKLDLSVKQLGYKILKHAIQTYDENLRVRIEANINMWDIIRKNGSKDRLNPVGSLDGIMIVGINPSSQSNLKSAWDDPFGKFFKKYLEASRINIDRIWLTNLYKKKTDDRLPNEIEIEKGLQELKQEIIYVNPKIIVALGDFVEEIISKEFKDIKIIKIKHPSYIRRNNTEENRSNYLLELMKIKNYE